jgi:hypothetical protein
LEAGYWDSYRQFYRWGNILRAAQTHDTLGGSLRHFAYTSGWKKFEPLWDWVIRAKRVAGMLPILERVLAGFSTQTQGNRVHTAGISLPARNKHSG